MPNDQDFNYWIKFVSNEHKYDLILINSLSFIFLFLLGESGVGSETTCTNKEWWMVGEWFFCGN